MIVQIFGIVISAANSTIDVMITGIFLGPNILAATGLFAPAATVMSMLYPFVDKHKTVHFEAGNLCFSMLGEAAVLGLPSLMFTVGCTVKGYMMNLTLMQNLGSAAVAVMNVQGNVCSVLGAIPMGCANAFMSLGSLYYGEEDRNSLLALTKYALKSGVILSAVAMAVIMTSSYYISDIFFDVNDEAFAISMRMLLLFPSFLIFNTIFCLFIKTYQFQGQTRLINILSLSENIIMAALAVSFTPVIASDAVWLAFPVSEVICIAIIMLSVFVYAKKSRSQFRTG